MTKKNTKKPSPSATSNAPEWVAVEDDTTTVVSHAQGGDDEPTTEPELDVVQHAPEEPTWAPADPAEAEGGTHTAPKARRTARAPGAKPGAPKAKAPKGATRDGIGKSAAAADAGDERDAIAVPTGEPTLPDVAQTVADPTHRDVTLTPTHAAAGDTTTSGARTDDAGDQAPNVEQRATDLPPMEQVIADLAKLSVPELVRLHVEMLGKRPKIKNRVWLQRKLAWHEQTRRFGGLSVAAKRRLEELMAEIELPMPTKREPKPGAPPSRRTDDMPIGTRLERTWHGRVIVAVRVDGGWECSGQRFASLSAAAKAVSGSHVSGPAFFKIWQPREATK